MLDMKFVRDNLDLIRAMLKNRNNSLSLDSFGELEQKRRAILAEGEQLKNQRNATSKKIGAMKKAGEDTEAIAAEVRQLFPASKHFVPMIQALKVQSTSPLHFQKDIRATWIKPVAKDFLIDKVA